MYEVTNRPPLHHIDLIDEDDDELFVLKHAIPDGAVAFTFLTSGPSGIIGLDRADATALYEFLGAHLSGSA